MKTRRTPIAIAIATLSLGLLAACSDEADQPAEAPIEQVTPAPSTAPGVDSTPPAPVEPAVPPVGSDPATNDPLNPVPEAAPSSSSTEPGLTEKMAESGRELQESARSAAATVGEKAGELRDATGERMAQMGDAIREGAAKADETIQDSLKQGGQPTSTNPTESETPAGT